MRILALDIGKKRIGVAISDPLAITATPLSNIEHTGYRGDREAIRHLVEQYQVEEIVIGLPRHLNGDLGIEAGEIKRFGNRLSQSLGVKVVFWDERLSTVAVNRALLEGNLSREKRRGVIDRLAATWILSGYLERRRSAEVRDND